MRRRQVILATLLIFSLFLSGLGLGHVTASEHQGDHHAAQASAQATASEKGHCDAALANSSTDHGQHKSVPEQIPTKGTMNMDGCCMSACAPTITSLNDVNLSVHTIVTEKLIPRPLHAIRSRAPDGLFKPPRVDA